MNSETLANAFHRLATGDRKPPEAPAPWAYLSSLNIHRVSELAILEVPGFTDQAGFDIDADGVRYRVMVQRIRKLEKLNAGDAGS